MNLKRSEGRFVLQVGDSELAVFVDLATGRLKVKDYEGNEAFASEFLPNAGSTSIKQVFTSTASQTDFTLTGEPNNVDVWVNGVYTQDYSLSASTVTLGEAPITGSEVVIRKYF